MKAGLRPSPKPATSTSARMVFATKIMFIVAILTFAIDLVLERNRFNIIQNYTNYYYNHSSKTVYQTSEYIARSDEGVRSGYAKDRSKRRRLMDITIQSRGRLGNELFQMAVLLGTGLRNKMNIVYNGDYKGLSKWFNIQVRPFVESKKRRSYFSLCNNDSSSEIDHRLYDVAASVPSTANGVLLCGDFYSYKYFMDFEEDIRSELKFKQTLVTAVETKMQKQHLKLSQKIVVGVHIRRGDFMRPYSIKRGRAVASTEYYKKAFHYMQNMYGNVTFLLSGYERIYALNELSSFGSLEFFRDGSPAEDLYALSSCDHVIISSGTFSWWVGWLNKGDVIYYDLYPTPGSSLATKVGKHYYLPKWIPMH